MPLNYLSRVSSVLGGFLFVTFFAEVIYGCFLSVQYMGWQDEVLLATSLQWRAFA